MKELDAMLPVLGVMLPVMGALVVGIWRFASLATRVDLTLKKLEDRIEDFDDFRDSVQQVPEHSRRIGQLEETMQAVVPRLAVVEKITSNRGFRAVRAPFGSRPQIPREDEEDR